MSVPRIVSADEWLAERKELLAAEDQAAEALANVRERRRELPAVRVEKGYVFDGPAGTVRLPDMFEGRLQLIVQHFMFDPAWDSGCPSCAASADEIGDGVLGQLMQSDTAFAMVSLAPLAKITPYKQRKGWSVPWYSSYGTDFNYDFHVTLDEKKAPVMYDYQSKEEILATDPDNELVGADISVEVPGISCFLRSGDSVFHTYSTYATEHVSAARSYLELTALGGRAI